MKTKQSKCQPRIPYLAKRSFKNEGQIMTFFQTFTGRLTYKKDTKESPLGRRTVTPDGNLGS